MSRQDGEPTPQIILSAAARLLSPEPRSAAISEGRHHPLPSGYKRLHQPTRASLSAAGTQLTHKGPYCSCGSGA